jgi:hypothetical protein
VIAPDRSDKAAVDRTMVNGGLVSCRPSSSSLSARHSEPKAQNLRRCSFVRHSDPGLAKGKNPALRRCLFLLVILSAAKNPRIAPLSVLACHSERSEESPHFVRGAIIYTRPYRHIDRICRCCFAVVLAVVWQGPTARPIFSLGRSPRYMPRQHPAG